MNIFTKKIAVPESNETKQIEVAQLWEVRWFSRRGSYEEYPHMCSAQPEVECFTSEAEAFALGIIYITPL